MAEEGEVWEEIRDALHQLVEQGERQTTLLEGMVKQGERRGKMGALAIRASIVAVVFAALAYLTSAFVVLLAGRGGVPREARVVSLLVVLALIGWLFSMLSRARRISED